LPTTPNDVVSDLHEGWKSDGALTGIDAELFLAHYLARLVGGEHVGGETSPVQLAVGASNLALFACSSRQREKSAVYWLCFPETLSDPMPKCGCVERLSQTVSWKLFAACRPELQKSTAFSMLRGAHFFEHHYTTQAMLGMKHSCGTKLQGLLPIADLVSLHAGALSELLASSSSCSDDEEWLDDMSNSDDVVEVVDCSFSEIV